MLCKRCKNLIEEDLGSCPFCGLDFKEENIDTEEDKLRVDIKDNVELEKIEDVEIENIEVDEVYGGELKEVEEKNENIEEYLIEKETEVDENDFKVKETLEEKDKDSIEDELKEDNQNKSDYKLEKANKYSDYKVIGITVILLAIILGLVMLFK
jgi:hypothetical protein